MKNALRLYCLLLLSIPAKAKAQDKELPIYYKVINNIYYNRRINRYFDRDLYDYRTQIKPMKTFFIENASRLNGAKPLACINTVRAGLETLLYGSSTIPASPLHSSSRALFRAVGSNRFIDLIKTLSDAGCVNDYKDIYFIGRNRRGDTIIINENNFRDSVNILAIEGSVWHAVLSMIPPMKGWSVFSLSLNNGFHTATLVVNHTDPGNIKMYWADQTTHHPVLPEDRLPAIPEPQFGWERMTELPTGDTRSLDEYCLYASRSFMNSEETDAAGQVKKRRNMPIIRLWKISKPAHP